MRADRQVQVGRPKVEENESGEQETFGNLSRLSEEQICAFSLPIDCPETPVKDADDSP